MKSDQGVVGLMKESILNSIGDEEQTQTTANFLTKTLNQVIEGIQVLFKPLVCEAKSLDAEEKELPAEIEIKKIKELEEGLASYQYLIQSPEQTIEETEKIMILNDKTYQTGDEYILNGKTYIFDGKTFPKESISLEDEIKKNWEKYKESGGQIRYEIFRNLVMKESLGNQDTEYYGCFGLTQISTIAFEDLTQKNKDYAMYRKSGSEYEKYLNEYLKNHPDQRNNPPDIYSEFAEELLKKDAKFNLRAGFDYFEVIEKNYGKLWGFSGGQAKEKYGYVGDETDLILIAYNVGVGDAKKGLIAFKEYLTKNGLKEGGREELIAFLNTDGKAIFGARKSQEILIPYICDINKISKDK